MGDGYRLKDLAAAAYLYASNLKLTTTEKDSLGRVWFIFDDKKKCEEHIRQFHSKEGIIAAKSYAEAMRSLKDMLFM